MKKKKKILILSDPNSVNSEIIYKAWKKINLKIKKKIIIVGNYELLKEQFRLLNYPIKLNKISNIKENNNYKVLNILDVKLKFTNVFKVKKFNASIYVKNCLVLGHKLALNNSILGLINCAVNKKLLPNNNGVTEFLAKKCKVKNNSEVMNDKR